jgi:hypothetical protein
MSRLRLLVICAGLLGASFPDAIALADVSSDGGEERIDTARQLFDLFGIDEAAFQLFAQGEPFREAEQEQLARVLMRLPQVKLGDIERWTRKRIEWDDVAARPAEYQRDFLRVQGSVRKVTRIVPATETQDRYALESYYRCEMTTDDGEYPAIVFARVVPGKWPIDRPMDEPASVPAVFLKTGSESAPGKRELYLAADRIAWHPDTPLGRLGMDYGLFDTIEQQRPITNQDRECFYQLLAAAGRMTLDESIVKAVDPAARLGPLTRNPQAHAGEPYTFRGVARRAIKIQISDPDVVARLGFDHYFEVVVFVDLNSVLALAGQQVRSYPVIYCVRSLPPGMPTGDEISEAVRASGFMFKKWPYTTAMTEEKRPDLRMTSPLLIGKSVTWERRDEKQTLVGPVAGGILGALIVGVGLFAWWFGRRERRARAALLAQRRAIHAVALPDDL